MVKDFKRYHTKEGFGDRIKRELQTYLRDIDERNYMVAYYFEVKYPCFMTHMGKTELAKWLYDNYITPTVKEFTAVRGSQVDFDRVGLDTTHIHSKADAYYSYQAFITVTTKK